MNDEVCSACQSNLGYGQVFHVGAYAYHPACFQCSDCRKVLTASDDFLAIGPTIYCGACGKQHAKVGYCGACGAELTSDYLQIRTAKFHPECFLCSGCNNPFGELGFAEIDGDVWCSSCVGEGVA